MVRSTLLVCRGNSTTPTYPYPASSGKAPLKCPHLKEFFWGLYFLYHLVSLYLPVFYLWHTILGWHFSGYRIRIKRQVARCLHSHWCIKGMGFSFYVLILTPLSWGMCCLSPATKNMDLKSTISVFVLMEHKKMSFYNKKVYHPYKPEHFVLHFNNMTFWIPTRLASRPATLMWHL